MQIISNGIKKTANVSVFNNNNVNRTRNGHINSVNVLVVKKKIVQVPLSGTPIFVAVIVKNRYALQCFIFGIVGDVSVGV